MCAADLRENLARGYSESALVYDATAGAQYLAGLYRLLPLVRVPPQPAILDVGCGTGLNLFEAARILGPCRLLCGIDLSPGMVAVAQAKAAALGIPAAITVGDAEALPYPDATFDLVICNSVLHWVRDRAKAVKEMGRVLRPGGQLLLMCAAQPGFGEWNRLVEGTLRTLLGDAAPPVMPPLPSPQDVIQYIQQAGLVPQYFQHLVTQVLVQDPVSFTRLMATVAPSWTAGLAPHVRAWVEQMIAAAMLLHAPGGYPVTWASIETVAQRPLQPAGRGG